jgi:uncharacterized protein
MSYSLPKFDYHPDPVATGSVIPSNAVCDCCGQAHGFIYDGPVFTEEEVKAICPWCIANGNAHKELGASFTDENGIGGYGEWEAVSKPVIEAIAYRTPGFTGWQQEQWWTHCGDAAEFLGRHGIVELEALGLEALTVIRESSGLEGEELELLMSALDRDGSPRAYMFRCRKCGRLGGYWDCD